MHQELVYEPHAIRAMSLTSLISAGVRQRQLTEQSSDGTRVLTLHPHGLARLIGGESGEQHGTDDQDSSSREAEALPYIEPMPLLVLYIDVGVIRWLEAII